jgi:hypothetical protein
MKKAYSTGYAYIECKGGNNVALHPKYHASFLKFCFGEERIPPSQTAIHTGIVNQVHTFILAQKQGSHGMYIQYSPHTEMFKRFQSLLGSIICLRRAFIKFGRAVF